MVLVMKLDILTLSSRSTGLKGGSLRTCGAVDSCLLERLLGVNKCLLSEGILSTFNKHLLKVSLASSSRANPKEARLEILKMESGEESPLSCLSKALR